MTFADDIATDFVDVVDGLTAITHVLRDESTQSIDDCLRRSITLKEATQSNGKFTTEDVAFHFPISQIAAEPELGSFIRDTDGDWTILAVQTQTLNNRYRLICRLLTIVDEQATLVTIQRAKWAKDATGGLVATWYDYLLDQRCKIQRDTATVEMTHDAQHMPALGWAYFQTQIAVTNEMRIVDVANETIYQIVGASEFDSISALFRVRIRSDKWGV